MDDPPPIPAAPGIFLDASAVLPFLAGDGWRANLRTFIENVTGMTGTRERFLHAATRPDPPEALLSGFGLTLDAPGVAESIPSSGPLIVVSNHLLGGADALALIALCTRRRSDFKILANDVAAASPGISHFVLPLSILGGRDAARKNAATLRAALVHLRAGGLLAVFPAGAVSAWRPDLGRVADAEWSPHVAALALKSQAPVLPVRFFGANPAWFHIAGAIHPFLRTAFILRVLLNSSGQAVTCRAGGLIPPADLQAADHPTATIRCRLESVDY